MLHCVFNSIVVGVSYMGVATYSDFAFLIFFFPRHLYHPTFIHVQMALHLLRHLPSSAHLGPLFYSRPSRFLTNWVVAVSADWNYDLKKL